MSAARVITVIKRRH